MKWKKQILFIGLISIALGAFLKTLRKQHRSSTYSVVDEVKLPVASTPSQDEIQQLAAIPSPSAKAVMRKSFRISSIFNVFVVRVRKIGPIISRSLNILAASALYIVALVLVVPWFAYTIMNIKDLSIPKEFANTQTISNQISLATNPSNSDLFPFTNDFTFLTPPNSAYLSLYFDQIKQETPTKATVSGILSLSIPIYFFTNICDKNAPVSKSDKPSCDVGSPIAYETSDKNVILKPQYDSEKYIISINSSQTASSVSQEYSFEQFFMPNSLPSVGAPITLPISSRSEAFPSDWFQSNSAIYVSFSLSSLYVSLQPYTSLSTPKDVHHLPIDVYATLDPSLRNLNIAIAPMLENPNDQDWILDVDFLIQRNIGYRLLIYFTAGLIPFALLVLLAHALFASRQKSEEPLYTITVNILVVMLTVIAVRQVFVPSDIQSVLTRLDLLLISEGTALLALIFIKYANLIMKSLRHTKD